MQLTLEERQRRAEQARKQHREGSLGSKAVARRAAQRSAEVRSRRASEMAQRLVEQNAEAVERELRRIIANGSNREKIDAMRLLITAGFQSEKIDQTERRDTTLPARERSCWTSSRPELKRPRRPPR